MNLKTGNLSRCLPPGRSGDDRQDRLADTQTDASPRVGLMTAYVARLYACGWTSPRGIGLWRFIRKREGRGRVSGALSASGAHPLAVCFIFVSRAWCDQFQPRAPDHPRSSLPDEKIEHWRKYAAS